LHRNARPQLEDRSRRYSKGSELLEQHTEQLLGPEPADRAVRIMVTMPSEAAQDYELVRDLLVNGMDCMRINCAHDDATSWALMIDNLRRATSETNRRCRILMDLPGPKLRTGPMEPGPKVMKWRARRDLYGSVKRPARIWLTEADHKESPPQSADAELPVCGDWLNDLKVDDTIKFFDARGASRSLKLIENVGRSWWAETTQTAYLAARTSLHLIRDGVAMTAYGCGTVGELPALEQWIHLQTGHTLILTRELRPGQPAVFDKKGRLVTPASLGVTLPEVFDCVRPGEKIWLDDGTIGGIIKSVNPDQLEVTITQTRPQGSKLRADKGINLPDTEVRLPALTEIDLQHLEFIAAHADIVGYSFVRNAKDVYELQEHLATLNAQHLGLVLKIESRRAFEELPNLLLMLMRSQSGGVMIARGDLAVECGWERMAEVQEEILWICEAAHLPVIWATQVLEKLTKEGIPSRAEITDAAMSERAECVMLNKGPFVVEAVRTLDDILRRMERHQRKKRSMLTHLRLADHLSFRMS
jgi:pyruvate kinase